MDLIVLVLEYGQEKRVSKYLGKHSNNFYSLTLCLLMTSADNLCKQLGPRSGPKCRAISESKLFGTPMVFLKEFFEKVDFEKNQMTKKDVGKA